MLVLLKVKKAGYYRLEFKGVPIIQREWMPKDKILSVNEEKGELTLIDINTEKITRMKI